jgi:hypothetical protein
MAEPNQPNKDCWRTNMKNRENGTLDIRQNVEKLKKPLYIASDLIEFFSEEFLEFMTHDDSLETRRRLRTLRTAVLDDLQELLNVLNVIDPDLVLKWHLDYWDSKEIDVK